MFKVENEKRCLVAALSQRCVQVSENCPHAGKEEPGMCLCACERIPCTTRLVSFSDLCSRRTLETHAQCCSARSCGGWRIFGRRHRPHRCRLDEETSAERNERHRFHSRPDRHSSNAWHCWTLGTDRSRYSADNCRRLSLQNVDELQLPSPGREREFHRLAERHHSRSYGPTRGTQFSVLFSLTFSAFVASFLLPLSACTRTRISASALVVYPVILRNKSQT